MSLWRQFLTVVMLCVALLALVHFYLVASHTLALGSFADTPVFVENAWNFLRTGELYNLTPPLAEIYSPTAYIYKFPPLYSLPYLLWLDPQQPVPSNIYKWFFALHLLRYAIAMVLCITCFGPWRNPRWCALVISLFCLSAPWVESIFGLTFDNLLLFCWVLCLLLLHSRWRRHAAWLLMYAAIAKLYPVIQLLAFGFSRMGWRLLWHCGLVGLVLLSLAVWAFGIMNTLAYYTDILPVLLREEISILPNNMSLISHWSLATGLPKSWFAMPLVILSAAFLLWVTRQLRSFPGGSAEVVRLEQLLFVFVTPLVLLLLTNYWGNYQLVLLLPIVVLLGGAMQEYCATRVTRWLVLLIAALPQLASANYPALLLPYMDLLLRYYPEEWRTVIGFRHYTPLVLWAGSALVLLGELRAVQRKNAIL